MRKSLDDAPLVFPAPHDTTSDERKLQTHMELVTPRFDNLQNELRRELDPKGILEEEIFQSAVEAAVNRRQARHSDRYEHDRAFFAALGELRAVQISRVALPRPFPPGGAARPAKLLMFPSGGQIAA